MYENKGKIEGESQEGEEEEEEREGGEDKKSGMESFMLGF